MRGKDREGTRPVHTSRPPVVTMTLTPPAHPGKSMRRCYNCNSPSHLAHDCKQKRRETEWKIRSQDDRTKVNMTTSEQNPEAYLYPDSDSDDVRTVTIEDKGSKPRRALVNIEGVPVQGIIDTGADISIMGPETFKKVASVAKLRKSQLWKSEKIPYTYDHKPFKLDGCLDLNISFEEKTMRTPIHVKMGSKEPPLLSEGVCRQLGIVTYHPKVSTPEGKERSGGVDVIVPAIRVHLVKSVKLLPQQSVLVPVQVDGMDGSFNVEPTKHFENVDSIHFGDTLVTVG